MEYLNLDKEQEIKEIKKIKKDEYPRMWLEDISEWYPYPGTEPFPKEWAPGDIVVVSHVGAVKKGEERKTYRITNNSKRKQEAGGFLLNLSDDIIKNLNDYDIMKRQRKGTGRKGIIYDKCPSETNMAESGENYPDEWLKVDWSLGAVQEDDRARDWQSKEPKTYYIVVADSKGSVWELLQFSVGSLSGWEAGQTVRLSKYKSVEKIYWMENRDKPGSQPITVRFVGWVQSKF